MSDFLATLERKVLLFDGAMGTQIQGRDLSVEGDFWGNENCSEILNLSRPDLVRDIHRGYLEAGADAVETNSFGGSPITLGEFDLADQAFEINRTAAVLAHEAIAQVGNGRQRFVIGAIGPGTRLPSLGHVDYRSLEQAFAVQAAGLIAGGADVILCETCQDPLQLKAAVNGARIAMREAGKDLPIMAQVTVETTGTMLVGTDIAAAGTIVEALDVPIIGLNCATGPQEMAEHLAHLAANWRGTDLGAAERRPARAGRRPDLLPARSRVARRLARALRQRGRRRDRRRLLRHHGRAHQGAGRDAAPPGRGRRAAAAEAAPGRERAAARLALQRRAAAPGERLSVDRRAVQRQRLEAVPRAPGGRGLGRLRRDRPHPGEGRLARARRLHRVCRPRRDRRHAERREPPARRRRCAPGVRFDRAERARRCPRALRRQGRDQLDQFRGRRGAGREAPGARARNSAAR